MSLEKKTALELAEVSGDAAWRWDFAEDAFEFSAWFPAWLRGDSREPPEGAERVAGADFRGRLRPEDRERLERAGEAAEARGEGGDFRVRATRGGGAEAALRVLAKAERGAEGRISGLVGVMRPLDPDASSSVDASAADADPARLARAAEGAGAGPWEMDVRGQSPGEAWPEAITMSTRLKAFAGLGPSFPDRAAAWRERVHPDDLEALRASARRHLEGEAERHEAEYRVRHEDGGWRWIHTRGRLLRDANGEPSVFAGMDWEVTDLREATRSLRLNERMLREISRMAQVGGWELEPGAETVRWTEMTRRIHEVEPDYEPTVEAALAFYVEDDRGRVRNAVRKACEEGVGFDFEARLRTARGNMRWVRSIGRPEMEKGECVRLWGVFQDITRQKETEEALLRAKDEAERANAAKSEFLAVMNHELRTPLNAIVGPCEMLLEETERDEDRDLLNAAVQASRHLLELVNRVLDLSKLEADRFEFQPEATKLRDFLVEYVGTFKGIAEQKGLRLAWDIADRAPERAVFDRTAVRQVLFNLIGNAIKFTRSGEVRVAVDRPNEAELVFAVADTGPGIPESSQEKIFEAFQQTDQAYSGGDREGTGLGLAICHQLAAKLGGRLELESELGRGSRFEFRLPWVDPEMSEAPAAPGNEEGALPDLRLDSDASRVLLVEDDRANRIFCEALLKKFDLPFDTATSGAEAVARFRGQNHTVVLMDIHLPDIDGLEAARRIREKAGERQPRIIAQTAFALPGQRREFLDSGVDDFLAKPIGLHAFADSVERAARSLADGGA